MSFVPIMFAFHTWCKIHSLELMTSVHHVSTRKGRELIFAVQTRKGKHAVPCIGRNKGG